MWHFVRRGGRREGEKRPLCGPIRPLSLSPIVIVLEMLSLLVSLSVCVRACACACAGVGVGVRAQSLCVHP